MAPQKLGVLAPLAPKEPELTHPGSGGRQGPRRDGHLPLLTPPAPHGGATPSPSAATPTWSTPPAWECSQGSEWTSLGKSCCRNRTNETSVGSA